MHSCPFFPSSSHFTRPTWEGLALDAHCISIVCAVFFALPCERKIRIKSRKTKTLDLSCKLLPASPVTFTTVFLLLQYPLFSSVSCETLKQRLLQHSDLLQANRVMRLTNCVKCNVSRFLWSVVLWVTNILNYVTGSVYFEIIIFIESKFIWFYWDRKLREKTRLL